MDKYTLLSVMVAVASLPCQAYVVTAGSLKETVSSEGAAQSFNLSGTDFSLVGTAFNIEPPCLFAHCLGGITIAIDDMVNSELGGVGAAVTISGVTYSFLEGAGGDVACCMEFFYTLSIPSDAIGDITLSAPFTMAGGLRGPGIPGIFFDGTGTASVQLHQIAGYPFPGPNIFELRSAVYNFGTAVPEPGTFALSIIAIAILYCLKRQHNAPV